MTEASIQEFSPNWDGNFANLPRILAPSAGNRGSKTTNWNEMRRNSHCKKNLHVMIINLHEKNTKINQNHLQKFIRDYYWNAALMRTLDNWNVFALVSGLSTLIPRFCAPRSLKTVHLFSHNKNLFIYRTKKTQNIINSFSISDPARFNNCLLCWKTWFLGLI